MNLIKLVLFISLISFSYAQSVFNTNEANITANANETNSSTNLPKLQSIFLSYEEIPQKVYVGEVFPIKVKAIIANDDFEELSTSLQDGEKIDILNPESKWQWFSDNIFYNTFYIKAKNTKSKLPNIQLNIYKNKQQTDSAIIEATHPSIIQLNGTKYFSNVIAQELKVKKYKTSQFDDKNYIVVLEIEAKQSNLEDFKLTWVTRDGIDSSVNNLPYYKIFYYAIIPNYIKKFDFTYFNSNKNQFDKISMPIMLSDDTVSTQIGLNPAESSIRIYKDFTYLICGLFLILLFIRRRKLIYIIVLILLVILFLYEKNPLNSIKIEKNTQIKILPTEKSTVFYTTNRILYAQKLDTKDEYIKILLPNGKIGWINNASEN